MSSIYASNIEINTIGEALIFLRGTRVKKVFCWVVLNPDEGEYVRVSKAEMIRVLKRCDSGAPFEGILLQDENELYVN